VPAVDIAAVDEDAVEVVVVRDRTVCGGGEEI
jgi:hypothetical protein